MGLFRKKDPAEEYENNKKIYRDKIAVARNKNVQPVLEIEKCMGEGHIAKIYVRISEGCLKINDVLEINYKFRNRLGIFSATGLVKNIYQIHGTGKNEKLVPVNEAYEQDYVWIDVPGIEADLVDKRSIVRKSQASNAPVADSNHENVTISSDGEVSKMVNYFKGELYNYFVSNKVIGHVTQDMSHSLFMQKKRLDRKGITMMIEKSSDIGAASMEMEVNRYSSSQYDVAEAYEPVNR